MHAAHLCFVNDCEIHEIFLLCSPSQALHDDAIVRFQSLPDMYTANVKLRVIFYLKRPVGCARKMSQKTQHVKCVCNTWGCTAIKAHWNFFSYDVEKH